MVKLFWSLACDLYTDLTIGGLDIVPPKFLFNQPKEKLECIYSDTILADTNFPNNERKLILEAKRDIEYFCNGAIELDIRFELDSKDKEAICSNNVLLRVTANHPHIKQSDERLESTTLGLCDWMHNDTIRLYLVPERLSNPISYRTTAMHELGHFISLDHTQRPSIMHKSNYSRVLYPTEIDARELARVWNYKPEQFRYFKL
jgi:hypothetical protein